MAATLGGLAVFFLYSAALAGIFSGVVILLEFLGLIVFERPFFRLPLSQITAAIVIGAPTFALSLRFVAAVKSRRISVRSIGPRTVLSRSKAGLGLFSWPLVKAAGVGFALYFAIESAVYIPAFISFFSHLPGMDAALFLVLLFAFAVCFAIFSYAVSVHVGLSLLRSNRTYDLNKG